MIPLSSATQLTIKVRHSNSAMGLYDYPQYVKYPMDLSTIHRKLREQRYRTVEEVLDDIQLIWDNCRCYNPTNSVKIIIFSGFTTFLSDLKRPLRKWWYATFQTSLSQQQVKFVIKSPKKYKRSSLRSS